MRTTIYRHHQMTNERFKNNDALKCLSTNVIVVFKVITVLTVCRILRHGHIRKVSTETQIKKKNNNSGSH